MNLIDRAFSKEVGFYSHIYRKTVLRLAFDNKFVSVFENFAKIGLINLG